MFDFGALPPEINSARMYSGPGSAPMMAAAAAWDALAAQLESYAAGYSSILWELSGLNWSGEASVAMSSAVTPYVEWVTTTAMQAEQSAVLARVAVGAFEAAFTATIPPPVVAANRVRLVRLVATNFFGQNTPAIAVTEAAYSEMWAQDAAAMYTYAASLTNATALTPFSEPPQATNPAGPTTSALSEFISAVAQQGQTLATGLSVNGSAAYSLAANAISSIVNAFSTFNTFSGPLTPTWQTTYSVFSAGQFGTGLNLTHLQIAAVARSVEEATSGAGRLGNGAVGGPVHAAFGNAAPVGKLSVPQGWASATPVANPVSLSAGNIRAIAGANADLPSNAIGGIPTAGLGSPSTTVPVLRNGRRIFKMPRPAFGG